jgi:hypothetical protein
MTLSRLGLAAVALLVSLPFLLAEHTSPIPSFHEEWLAAALGLLAGTALLDARRLPLPGAALLALTLAAIALAQEQMGFAPVPQLATLFGLYLLWAALLACTSRHLAETLGRHRLVRVLAAAVFAGSLLAALTSLLAPWLTPPGWAGLPPQMGGALAQPNHFSTYLWLGLASALYLRSTSTIALPTFWIASSLLTLTATLAGQRSSLLYLAALVAINFWQTQVSTTRGPAQNRRLALGICFLFLLMQPLASLWPVSSDGLRKPPPTIRAATFLHQEPVRLQLWRVGAEGVLAAPIFGNGIGSYPRMALAYADRLAPDANPGSSEHTHNVLVELAAELGLPAALLLILGVGLWLRRLPDSGSPAETGWAAAVVVMLGLHSLIEYPLWHTYFLGLLAVVAGAFGPPRAIGKRLLPIALSIGLLVWGSLTLWQLRRDYAQLQLAHVLGRQPAAMAMAGEALQRIPATSLLVPWVATTACLSLDPLRVPVNDGQAVCRIGLAFAPTIECVVNAAIVQWRGGDKAGARRLLQKLRGATRQHGAETLDSATSRLIARDPQLRALLAADE